MIVYFINIFLLLLLFLSIALTSSAIKRKEKKCSYDNYTDAPEVYYINLKTSENRRKSMERLLNLMKFRYFRIEGVTSSITYVPNDLIQSNNSKMKTFPEICKFQTNETIDNSVQKMKEMNKSYLVDGLCTSGTTKWTELYCSLSHLQAIYQAIHSSTATSKYALIMEDDIYIPFSIDFNALAASAPVDFGVLQLMNANRGKQYVL